ncbi:MAG TPA: recombinase family protein [Terriglobales bacterium]|jgi:DNA invertase Pin-like site-specific DNA recombinase|nr:recombinase family protein [Terriglobales bacterium]
MKIGIYARISTRKQDELNQLAQLREFAAKQGWEIAVEFVDTVSGSGKKERPQFKKMMLAASQKQFDLLLFWALDRLSREGIVKTIGYLEELKGWGVGWRSFTQPFLDTGNEMTTGIVLSVLAAVAKQERITISERTRAGLARAVKQGATLGRRPVKVNVDKAHAMQRDGLGLRPIAKKLGCSVNTLQRALSGAQKRSTRHYNAEGQENSAPPGEQTLANL